MQRSNISFLLLIILTLAAFSTAEAQDCLDYSEFYPDIAPIGLRIHGSGNAETVFQSENILYVATDSALQLFDVTNPDLPVYLSKIDLLATALITVGNSLYVGSDEGWLMVVDVSDPESPGEPTEIPLTEGVMDFSLQDNHLFVATGWNVGGLLILDVTNPASPQRKGQAVGALGFNLCVDQQRAYLISPSIDDGNSYLTAISLVDLNDPQIIGSAGFQGRCMSAGIVDQMIFAATAEMGVRVIDVSDESGAYVVATAAGTVGAQGIVLHPPLGYVSLKTPSGETSFATILVNDPLEPLLLGSTSLSDWGFNLAFANNRVFVADREGMPSIVDVGLPNYPFELTWMAESPYEPLTAMALDAYQDFVYVANLSGEPLLIYDMSDPTNPHKVGSVAGDDQPSRISIHENLLYMTAFPEDSGVSTRLWVYDLDDPLQPAFLSSLDLGFYKSLTAAPGAVYMPINGRIGVVDMSDPENPFYVGSVNPPGYGISTHVCVSDGMLYASMSQDGVIMYDVSDPTNLVEKGGYDLGSAAETEVHGQYAVTVDGLTGFSVVDISIYENPVVLSSELTPDYPRHVNLDWPLAYITGNEGEVWVYDLSDPEVPEMLGSTAQMVVGGTAAFAGPWLVSPMHDRGLGLTWRACFELTGAGGNLPGSPLAISAYPNPFNPMTTVSYNVDHDALVRLEVFDASGRRVSTLAQGFHSEGQYRVSWDGRNQMGQSQASGVYLLRIEAGDQVSQSKMTLVR